MWMAATDFDNKKDEIIAEVAKITAKYPMYE
jgi:hypothetical protein